jgi:hypothetical protein
MCDDNEPDTSLDTVYVDVPDWRTLGPESEEGWKNVSTCQTKAEAVEWIRKNIDPNCDDDGRICLITGV